MTIIVLALLALAGIALFQAVSALRAAERAYQHAWRALYQAHQMQLAMDNAVLVQAIAPVGEEPRVLH